MSEFRVTKATGFDVDSTISHEKPLIWSEAYKNSILYIIVTGIRF